MTKSAQFKVHSHVLKLLGDQLIGHDRLAVFELVKNSYDADAKTVTVTLDLLAPVPKISVRDDGIGMSADTIENVWLQVGTDSKRNAEARKRSPLGRFPLGEKGVGRLAVQKLGDTIRLVTRQEGKAEHFAVLKPWLTTEADEQPQAVAAGQLGLSEAAVKVAIHRLRQRFRAAVRTEIAQTVSAPEAVEEELESLRAALRRG